MNEYQQIIQYDFQKNINSSTWELINNDNNKILINWLKSIIIIIVVILLFQIK